MAQEFTPVQGIGIAGIVSDIAPVELPPNIITDAHNMRSLTSGISFTGSYENLSVAPEDFEPGWLIHNHVTDNDRPTWLIAGSDKIYRYIGPDLSSAVLQPGSDWADITAEGQAVDLDQLQWTGCNLGKMTMVNHPDDQPYYFDNILGTQMQYLPFSLDLSWSDAGKSFEVLRSYKNFLFALNLTEDGEHYPDGYRWSHPADANGYPYTWDENDLSGLASRESLGGGDGEIIDGLALRDSFVIYSEHGIDVLDYTGDDLLFKRRSLDTDAGLLATNCVVAVAGDHYFISDGDVMRNDGTTVVSVMHDKVRGSFISDINKDTYKNSYVVLNPLFNEVWCCIPTTNNTLPDLAYIYNYKTSAWSKRDIPAGVSFMAAGAVSLPKVTWGSVLGTWGDANRTWSSRKITPQSETLVGCVTEGSELLITEPTGAINGDVDAFVERVGIPVAGIRQITTINAIYPHILGSVDLVLQLGYQDFPDGAVTWGPEYQFNPRQDRKVDVRSTGALHCYRISSKGKAPWTLTGFDMEFVMRGLR